MIALDLASPPLLDDHGIHGHASNGGLFPGHRVRPAFP